MFILPLAIVIVIALAVTLSRNGIGSFVTLGIIGAAIYTIPALIDTQVAIGARATGSQLNYVGIPNDVDFVVLVAWMALLTGLIVSVVAFPVPQSARIVVVDDPRMRSVAMACAVIGPLGLLYFMYSQNSLLFFLEVRAEQDTGAFSTLWRWTAVLGLISASLARDRRLLIVNAVMLLIIFLRGDRTLVAIATAALVVVASYKDPRWWRRLRASHIAGFLFAAGAVFLGKTIYILTKTAIVGGKSGRWQGSLGFQFLNQFEPLGTFSHLEFVMRTGIRIPMTAFLESVGGNLLIIPSVFGISTNLYNATVTSHLSAKLSSGIAGNYLAHGYAVGGLSMAALFYFMLPLMLRLCDAQFRKKAGIVKVFWCCVGAVLAFYIQRNGLDNLFSFVRQIFIVCVATAAVAATMRHIGLVAAPIGTRRPLVAGGAVPATGFDIAPRNSSPAPDPRGRPVG